MGLPSIHDAGVHDGYRGTLRYRLAVNAMPLKADVLQPYSQIDWMFASIKISVGIDPVSPSIDFIFPKIKCSSYQTKLKEAAPSANLIEFPRTRIISTAISELLEEVQVSDDLLEPFTRAKTGGKVYENRTEKLGEQHSKKIGKPALTHQDKDGFRKSYSITKSGYVTTRKLMQIWDLVLPLLLPPLSMEFSNQLVLPHELYDFQRDGVKFLAEHTSALLGDDMGTGKTIQTIVAMRMLFQNGTITSALIIVPVSLMRNWDKELLKWAEPLSGVTAVRGTPEERQEKWEQLAHIYIATYSTIRTDIDHILQHRKFDVVVIDEVQNIKNRGAAQTKAIKQLDRKIAWGLSGTPIENRIDDLVSIFEFLKPGLLPIDGTSPQMAKQRIKPYFLRRRKEDVLKDLPPKRATHKWLDLEDDQRAAYDLAENTGVIKLKKLGASITVQNVLALLTRLKQICNRDPVSGQSCKLEYLKEKLREEIPKNCKALVFSQFVPEGVELLATEFDSLEPAIIHGGVSGLARDREVERFQKDEKCRLFVATPKSGGVGITLVRGNYVFHFDHWWNPATGRQAEDRAHRIGQTRDVFVTHLWTSNTVEEKIHNILERKQQLYAEVIDELSNIECSGLSESELFGLFNLKAPSRNKETATPSATPSLLRNIIAMGPEGFEQLIARVYDSLGYGTRVTQASRDGGVDVEASSTTTATGRELLAIQCKCYSPGNNVGRPDCQKLLGVLANTKQYTKGIIVTTSDFTPDAREAVKEMGKIQLIDGKGLLRLIEESGVNLEMSAG